ncbi:B3 domain-containing protein, DNA-binding pseudobarrel domain protein (mitochondrion) [Artemisia annua]|uniref:B3 domain-containing protein, DNA-binding pseudobarrel domain protein n=1 Tax=Artemisia annua TaxID=35608 RepID=A0A2U1QA06_ARTAN|nr:B3 domain-containing protein, DNA-binding pseudobarrel domain protein [Artemisia annua]
MNGSDLDPDLIRFDCTIYMTQQGEKHDPSTQLKIQRVNLFKWIITWVDPRPTWVVIINKMHGPQECPPTVMSTWITKLQKDAKLCPKTAQQASKSLVNNRTAFPIRFIPTKKPIHPTCEDALAALVKEPVNMKKRTKRVKCEHVVSSHENEQGLLIVCWDPLASQAGAVLYVGAKLKDLKLVIQKVLYVSDLKPNKNRLNFPRKQLITEIFLTTEERSTLENKEEIEVRLVGPTLKMYKEPMGLKMWKMARTENFVLKT